MKNIHEHLKYYERTFDIRSAEVREARLKEWKRNWQKANSTQRDRVREDSD